MTSLATNLARMALVAIPVAYAQVVNSEVTTQFSDTLSVARAAGAPTVLRAELKEWHLTAHNVPIEVPDQGFSIVHVISGTLSVHIGDKTEEHGAGDFWTVDKGQRMVITIKAPAEQAMIQTFSVNPAAGH